MQGRLLRPIGRQEATLGSGQGQSRLNSKRIIQATLLAGRYPTSGPCSWHVQDFRCPPPYPKIHHGYQSLICESLKAESETATLGQDSSYILRSSIRQRGRIRNVVQKDEAFYRNATPHQRDWCVQGAVASRLGTAERRP